MKKTTIFTLIGLAFLLTGCTTTNKVNNEVGADKTVVNQNTTVNTNLNQAPSNVNQNTNDNVAVDPLAGWLTNNRPLNMPIVYKYPATWSIIKFGGTEISGDVEGPKGNPVVSVQELREWINKSNDKNQSLQDAYNKNQPSNITLKENVKIDGYDAIKVQHQTAPTASRGKMGEEIIYIKYQQNFYSITFLDWNKTAASDSPYYSIYQEILSTFKFLDIK